MPVSDTSRAPTTGFGFAVYLNTSANDIALSIYSSKLIF
jgi:hypothetical protein